MARTDKDLAHEVQGRAGHVVDLTQGPGSHRLLTVREVAKRLSVSTKTVYRLKDEGALAYMKVRGSLRFREQDVEGLETRCRVAPGRYVEVEEVIPTRLNLQFEVSRRGRGSRRK